MDWNPNSWATKKVVQMADYPDETELKSVLDAIGRLPPLVTSWEVNALKDQLARAAKGEYFLLQGGDCAESFDDCDADTITANLKVLLQMSLVLVHATKKRLIRIGRIAGQYAKPRSAPDETRDGVTLPSYRGDLVNRAEFSPESRRPDPQLLLRGYKRSALTLNFIRALLDGGFADLHHPENWDLSFVKDTKLAAEYGQIVDAIRDSIHFMEAVLGAQTGAVDRATIFTSHEGLSLHYEQAQTRQVPRRTGWYNLSTHFPWLGMRTTDVKGAHVEYFRGIENPIGIKVGAGMTEEHLSELLSLLDPKKEPGRITLIHRFGAGAIEEKLPPLVDFVRRSNHPVLWCADPMHGNTESTDEGTKTRQFENVVKEIELAFDIHHDHGSHLGGVHLELTGKDVTECIGGAGGLDASGLKRAYKTPVDPRLNYEQSLEVAMLIARHIRAESR